MEVWNHKSLSALKVYIEDIDDVTVRMTFVNETMPEEFWTKLDMLRSETSLFTNNFAAQGYEKHGP